MAMEPRLFFPHDKGLRDEDGFSYNNICLLTSKSSSYSPKNLPRGGWLVKICDEEDNVNSNNNPNNGAKSKAKLKLGDCFLWNSVSSEVIQLPSLLYWITSKSFDEYYLYLSVLCSSSPTQIGGGYNDNNNDLDDSVSRVFLLFNSTSRYSDFYLFLLYCRPGDSQWRREKLEISSCSVQSLICMGDDKLYIMCDSDSHLEIEIFDETLSIRSFSIKFLNRFPSIGGRCSVNRSQFVKAGDEIYRVVRHYYPGNVNDKVFEIHVYRIDMSSMVWEEVRSLGDFVFFLDEPPTTAAYYSAADFGLTRGCLYYTMPKDKSLYKFDLEDNSITMSLIRPTPVLSSANWVCELRLGFCLSVCTGTNTRRTKRKVRLDKIEEEDIFVLEPGKKNSVKDHDDQGQNTSIDEIKGSISLVTLHEDILKLIATTYLHPFDYFNFRSICRSNRLGIPTLKWNSPSVQSALSLSEMLIYYEKDEGIFNFVDPMRTNGMYVMKLYEFLSGATIRFSKGNWLLMSNGSRKSFFFNPFTKQKIELPDFPVEVGTLSAMCFSSLPTSSDCEIFAITKHDLGVVVCLIRVGIWLYQPFRFRYDVQKSISGWYNRLGDRAFKPGLSSSVFYQGAFYCLDVNGTLGFCYASGSNTWRILSDLKRPCNLFNQCYLVECEGNLLSLFVGNLGQICGIYILDFSDMKWVEVKSLGKYVLFISNTSCILALARDSKMENKIFFSRFHEGSIIYYSLDTGKYHSAGRQHSATNFYNTKERLACSWIEPNWS